MILPNPLVGPVSVAASVAGLGAGLAAGTALALVAHGALAMRGSRK